MLHWPDAEELAASTPLIRVHPPTCCPLRPWVPRDIETARRTPGAFASHTEDVRRCRRPQRAASGDEFHSTEAGTSKW